MEAVTDTSEVTSEAVDEATSEKNEEAVTEEATLAPEAESEVAAPRQRPSNLLLNEWQRNKFKMIIY